MAPDYEPKTTAGMIALGNLEARIDGWAQQAARGRLTVGERAELVDLIALRGHVLGRITDAERAAALADESVRLAPGDARSFVARARMAAVFHRFASALADLDAAASGGSDRTTLDAERAVVYQALGRYDDAFEIRRRAVEGHPETGPDFGALGGLAGLYGERGQMVEADHWFAAARHNYRGVSPFPLAMLDFQCGRLWMEHGDLHRARLWCEAAVRRIPAYVPALGHLAEIKAALGERSAALSQLRPLALASDDPDYAAQLARVLSDAGQTEEAQAWRARAEARYNELLAHHPEAFVDHAAEFWLTIGGDPKHALRLARQNLALRQTPRARALVRRATGRIGSSDAAASPSQ